MSAALGRGDARYRVERFDGFLGARNPAQGLRVRFDTAGAQLALRGGELGIGLAGTGAAPVRVGSNRVVYRRPGLSEWFANGPIGLEQGFTLKRPQPLMLRLSGPLARKARLGAGGVSFGSLVYRDLVVTDATGRRLPARFELAGRRLRIRIDARRARYPIRVDPIFQQVAELTASDGSASQQLGFSVAVSGDTIAAGMYTGPEAVYVFVKPAGGWADATQTAKLTASDGAFPGRLGYSVAISGNTIVAGAPYAQVGSNSDQGAVYVFTKPANGWKNATQTARLTASDGVAGDYLGYSVGISGTTIAAGAVYENDDQGATYVYVEPNSGWTNATQTAKLTSSDDGAYELGGSVAVSGNTIAIGDADATVGTNSDQGAVYVYAKPNSGWTNATQTATLTASDGSSGNELGLSVAVSGATIAAGATGVASGEGAVYVFVEPNSGWTNATQTAKLTASGGVAGDQLGTSVAASSDTIVAGAPRATVGGNAYQGAIYVFNEPGAGWANETQAAKLTAVSGAADDELGLEVALDGDTIAAGDEAVTVGGNTYAGAVYAFGEISAPGAPTAAAATAGNARSTVFWSPPASNGGAAITKYTVTAAPGGKTCGWTSGPLHCTVLGLTNGTPYTFTVTATNSVGTGLASSATKAVTPATVPDAPTHVTATPGNAQATVSWSAPASSGGASITGYTVTASPGGKTCSWTSGPLTCTVTGLTNGTAYTFTVTAANRVGTGAASAASKSATPTDRVVVTVVKKGTGSGTVTSTNHSIDCEASCSSGSNAYVIGATVNLTATPAAGSTFVGWSGGGCSGTEHCIFTATKTVTITATFKLTGSKHPGGPTRQGRREARRARRRS